MHSVFSRHEVNGQPLLDPESPLREMSGENGMISTTHVLELDGGWEPAEMETHNSDLYRVKVRTAG